MNRTERENALHSPNSNVVRLRPYQRKAARRRRRAWLAALFGVELDSAPKPKPAAADSPADLVQFRSHLGAARR